MIAEIKKILCGRFRVYRTYRKLLKTVKNNPEFEIEKIKIIGAFKSVEARIFCKEVE